MRKELVIFAALATTLVLGILLLLLLPGRAPTPVVTTASSSASAAPRPAPSMPPPLYPPTVAESASAAPTVDEPQILATGTEPVVSAKVPMHSMDEPDPEFLFEKKDVTSTIAKYKDRLQPCARDAASSVTVLVKVQPDGWVESARVQSFSGDEAQATCVKDAIAKWHFPSTSNGATVSIPFALKK
ncbi:MAG: hypothetical protein NVSMB47_20070 [Polyangiales bacterium]